jgi:glutamate carboxypeptidase
MKKNLRDLFAEEYPNYLRDLETLVNLDCGSYNKAGVDRVVAYVKGIAARFGAQVIEYPQDQYGDQLYVRLEGNGDARIFLMGHTDTVYDDGIAAQFPFRLEEDCFKGAGVNDMKAGLLAGLYAMKTLRDAGFDQFGEIAFFINSDEEVGSPVSRALYPALARGADAALVLESARENGDIVSARKGSGTFHLRVHGKSAHAGVEPEKGANAIVALARYIDEIAKLNGLRAGLTVNVGIVKGGTRGNVVPDAASAEIDVRVARAEDERAFVERMNEIVAREFVPGTRATWSGKITSPPMEKSRRTARLVEWAQAAARENGFEIGDQFTGGASDGNMIAGEDVPVLDGLGPIGGKDHNAEEEYIAADSIIPRVAMLARLIETIALQRAKLLE